MSQQGCLVAPKQVGQKHLGVAARILGGSGQASASRLQCLTGAGRHFMPQWLFQP